MTVLFDTAHLLARLLRQTARMPVVLFISLIQPIVWLLLFGQLFRAVVSLDAFGTDSYLQFFTPGVVVMAALFGSGYAGMGTLADLHSGVLDRMLATPVSRAAIVAAWVLHTAVAVTVQAAVMLGLALALGVGLPGGVAGGALMLVAAALLGAGVGAASHALALLARKQETMFAVMNFVLLPATFVSTILMTDRLMPDWMRGVAAFNPVNWAAELARGTFGGMPMRDLALNLSLLVAFALVCAMAAAAAFRSYRQAT